MLDSVGQYRVMGTSLAMEGLYGQLDPSLCDLSEMTLVDLSSDVLYVGGVITSQVI